MARINLNTKSNGSCLKQCNKELRQTNTENDLCTKLNSIDDNLAVRCVGEWAEQKIYFLYQYFGIFSEGMKNKWKNNINYVEICSGPGRCINRKNGDELDGTALSILKHKSFVNINKAFFFDFNETVVDVLNQRIKNIGITNAKALVADYYNADDLCSKIYAEISNTSLNLVFIDPTDCSVPFQLIQKIKNTLPNVDFIINVATGTDFNRNIPMAFQDKERAKKYITFLGDDSFFVDSNNKTLCKNKEYEKLRECFRTSYQSSLQRIGFNYFDIQLIEHYYDILFAASHSRAMDFWKKATKIKHDGQKELF